MFPQSGLLLMVLSTPQSTVGFPFLAILSLSPPLSIVFPKDRALESWARTGELCTAPESPKPASCLQGSIFTTDA